MPLEIKIEQLPPLAYNPVEKKEEEFKSTIQKPKRKIMDKRQLRPLPIKPI